MQRKSIIGLFRFMNLETAQKQEESGLGKLRNPASGELRVEREFVKMVFKKTSDPVPESDKKNFALISLYLRTTGWKEDGGG
jgi:hypothetical protein